MKLKTELVNDKYSLLNKKNPACIICAGWIWLVLTIDIVDVGVYIINSEFEKD